MAVANAAMKHGVSPFELVFAVKSRVASHDSQTTGEQRKEFMAQAASAFERCACRGDSAAIKAFAWTRHGRHWGSPTVSFSLEVVQPSAMDAQGQPGDVISAPKDAKWSEVHARVIDAAKQKKRVSLAAF